MTYDEKLAARVRDFFKQRAVAFEEISVTPGLCFVVEDKMCVGVENDRLRVRIDPATYEQALRRTGCFPTDFTGRPIRDFVFVNEEGYSTDRDLALWLELALDFNLRAKPSTARA